jgi:hypothetical protein
MRGEEIRRRKNVSSYTSSVAYLHLRRFVYLTLAEDRYLLVSTCVFGLCLWYSLPSLGATEQEDENPLWWSFSCVLLGSTALLFVMEVLMHTCLRRGQREGGIINRYIVRRFLVDSFGMSWTLVVIIAIFSAYEESLYGFVRWSLLFSTTIPLSIVLLTGLFEENYQLKPFWRWSFQLIAMSFFVLTFVSTYFSTLRSDDPFWLRFPAGNLLVFASILVMWNCPGASVDTDLIWYASGSGGGSVAAMKLCISFGADVDFQDQLSQVPISFEILSVTVHPVLFVEQYGAHESVQFGCCAIFTRAACEPTSCRYRKLSAL